MNCRNFYILLQTELCLNMWDLNSVIFVQEDRLFGLSAGKWSSWNFFFAFYVILIRSEGLGPHSTLIWRGWPGLVTMVTMGPVSLMKLTRKGKLLKTLGFFLDFFPQLISTTRSWNRLPMHLVTMVTMGPVCLIKLSRKQKCCGH